MALAQSAHATLWPKGKDFPVGAYGVASAADMATVAADGFNLVHTYSYQSPEAPGAMSADQYCQTAATYGLNVMLQLGTLTPSEPNQPQITAANVQHFSSYSNVAWWYLVPEELRYWVPADMNILSNGYATVKANDPQQRPVFHYIPTNYAASDLVHYPPYQDALGAGAYANYALQPRPWVKWRIDQETQAIAQSGNLPGRFPIGVLQLFPPESVNELPMTGLDAYHDAYLSLVCGAKALQVFSAGYRNAVSPSIYQNYKKVAQELNGPYRIGEVFLLGTSAPGVTTSITSGPLKSQSFVEGGTTFQYDSITSKVAAYNGHVYIASVNSATLAVGASYANIRPNDSLPIDVPLESRSISLSGRSFSDSFGALKVHIYKLPASADLVSHEDTFDSAPTAWSPLFGSGSMTAAGGIATVNKGAASTEYFQRNLTAGSLPEGGFLELKVKADASTQYYLSLLAPNGTSTALINWQTGNGDWQILRTPFAGSWKSANGLVMGIRAGASFQVDSLGMFFHAPNPVWTADADGNWGESMNWTNGVPNAIAVGADFGASITAPRTVTLDSPQTAGQINFNSAARYTLAGATLTLDNSLNPAAIQVVSGSHTISAPIAAPKGLTLNVSSGASTLTLQADLLMSGTASLVKTGSGTAEIRNARVPAIQVTSGTLKVAAGAGNNSSGSTSRTASLSVAGSPAPTGRIDLGNSAMIIDHTGTSPAADIQALLKSGYATGNWTGNGLTSSSAASAAGGPASLRTSIGYAEAASLGTTSFAGQTFDSTTLILAYTLAADANLDGKVNNTDFNQLAGSFGATDANWLRGDFTYDGIVNAQDFNVLVASYGSSLAFAAPSLGTLIPEPGVIACTGLMILLASRRIRF
jgi:hypothetical protein